MSASSPQENRYLDEVIQNQQQVDNQLKRRKASFNAPEAVAGALAAPTARAMAPRGGAGAVIEPMGGGARAVDYRITGFMRWKTVIVPPNVYVVHTRRGRPEPLHIGMGISFRYNPNLDAFLVIPAAMQTIVINARCICVERQGIMVQAYVQWIIDDIATAYRRLDFSDAEDPMGVVNVQLREQAEAAIKDKVATMHIDEVLADKQPIIAELTTRLRTVAEGSRSDEKATGLGLKIVTVQIKEAVVSSTHLWENLQRPFRAERERLARLAELDSQKSIAEREREIRQARETSEIATARDLARIRAEQERETFDRAHAEAERRRVVEQESERAKRLAELELALQAMELDRQKVNAEIETIREQRKSDTARAERTREIATAERALADLRSQGAATIAERELGVLRLKRTIENDVTDGHLRARLIEQLPEVAAKLQAPAELRSITISGDAATNGPAASLTGFVASVLALLQKDSTPAG